MLSFAKAFLAGAILLLLPLNADAGSHSGNFDRAASKRCSCTPEFQPQRCRPQTTHPGRSRTDHSLRGPTKPDNCYVGETPEEGCRCISPTSFLLASATDHPPPPAAVDSDAGSSVPPAASPPDGAVCGPVICEAINPDACCAPGTPAELAALIQQSQTACSSWDRRVALLKLGNRYSCCCHPDVMRALLYALNDPDERVRFRAADEIGDQLRANPYCCDCSVLSALKYALADCDRLVRRQAEEALRAAGYDVTNGCCSFRGGRCAADGSSITSMPVSNSPVQMTAAVSQTSAPPALLPVYDQLPSTVTGPDRIAPPPPEQALPFIPPVPGQAQAAEERDSPQADAPVPEAVRPAVNNLAQREQNRLLLRMFEQSPRKQPIRQGLSNLFSQAK